MATVLIIALAAVWLVVVWHWRDSSRNTASAIETQQRALAAIRTATETARARRRPKALSARKGWRRARGTEAERRRPRGR